MQTGSESDRGSQKPCNGGPGEKEKDGSPNPKPKGPICLQWASTNTSPIEIINAGFTLKNAIIPIKKFKSYSYNCTIGPHHYKIFSLNYNY